MAPRRKNRALLAFIRIGDFCWKSATRAPNRSAPLPAPLVFVYRNFQNIGNRKKGRKNIISRSFVLVIFNLFLSVWSFPCASDSFIPHLWFSASPLLRNAHLESLLPLLRRLHYGPQIWLVVGISDGNLQAESLRLPPTHPPRSCAPRNATYAEIHQV